MTKKTQLFSWKYYVLFFGIIILVFMGCENNKKEYYFGTWENTRDAGTIQITISEDSIIGRYVSGSASGANYTLDKLIWVKKTNEDPSIKGMYPNGFFVTGTVTNVNNITNLSLGEQLTWMIYINKDKNAFIRMQENQPNFIFNKIE